MRQGNEIRFTTFIDGHTECEVYATIENGMPVIQSINVVGDCVVTLDDLDDKDKNFFLSEARRFMAERPNQ